MMRAPPFFASFSPCISHGFTPPSPQRSVFFPHRIPHDDTSLFRSRQLRPARAGSSVPRSRRRHAHERLPETRPRHGLPRPFRTAHHGARRSQPPLLDLPAPDLRLSALFSALESRASLRASAGSFLRPHSRGTAHSGHGQRSAHASARPVALASRSAQPPRHSGGQRHHASYSGTGTKDFRQPARRTRPGKPVDHSHHARFRHAGAAPPLRKTRFAVDGIHGQRAQ